MLENGGLRLFLPKMQALYHSGWHPGNIYSCWNCTKEVIQTAKIDIKIITHNQGCARDMYIVLEQNANMSYPKNFLTKIFANFFKILKNND